MNKILMSLLVAGLVSTSVVHAAGYGVVDLEKVVENSTYLKQQKNPSCDEFCQNTQCRELRIC